jgi:hypothetical protein
MNQPIRTRLAKWIRGDRERVSGCWTCHATATNVEAVAVRSELYRQKFPDEPPMRLEFEAKLDVLALQFGKKSDNMLGWLADFDAAASEVVATWPKGGKV